MHDQIKIFADGANLKSLLELNQDPTISGLTTNPTLMRKAGITDYENFSKELLAHVTEKPVSLEVFSDEFSEMKIQAEKISSWGNNVYVKIPITNSKRESSQPLITELSAQGIKLNVTAILTQRQVEQTLESLAKAQSPAIISLFAGRIADTGVDPTDIMRNAALLTSQYKSVELLWASVREVFNIQQAINCECDIVTVPPDILAKARKMFKQNLEDLSLETVQMFYQDALNAGYSI